MSQQMLAPSTPMPRRVDVINGVPMIKVHYTAGARMVRMDEIYNVPHLSKINRAKAVHFGAKVRVKMEEMYDPYSKQMVLVGPCGVVSCMDVRGSRTVVKVRFEGEQDYLTGLPMGWMGLESEVKFKALVCVE